MMEIRNTEITLWMKYLQFWITLKFCMNEHMKFNSVIDGNFERRIWTKNHIEL